MVNGSGTLKPFQESRLSYGSVATTASELKSALYQEVWLWTPLVLYATVVWNKLYMLFETVLSLCLSGIIWESQAAVASPFLKTFRPG